MVKLNIYNKTFCPKCSLATIEKHPMADNEDNVKYHGYVKCNFCGYTAADLDYEKELSIWLKTFNKEKI